MSIFIFILLIAKVISRDFPTFKQRSNSSFSSHGMSFLERFIFYSLNSLKKHYLAACSSCILSTFQRSCLIKIRKHTLALRMSLTSTITTFVRNDIRLQHSVHGLWINNHFLVVERIWNSELLSPYR